MALSPLTAEEEQAAPPRLKTVEEIHAEFLALKEQDVRLQSRWLIALAVANGGALTALSAKLLDVLGETSTRVAQAAVALALPSLWLFMLGFLAVGGALLTEMLRNQRALREAHRSLRIRAHYPQSVTQDQLSPSPYFSWTIELAAGACFVVGLLYPVVVLGIRYVQHGGVSW